MEKIKMTIKDLRQSRMKMFYDLILAEEGGDTAVTIPIGEKEADNIAIILDKLEYPRPLIYDVVTHLCKEFTLSLKEIIVHEFYEGNFFAKAVFANEQKTVETDLRPSDAVNLALRLNSPIYVSSQVADQAGFSYSDYYNKMFNNSQNDNVSNIDNLSIFGINMLNDLLRDALEKEDYVTAAVLRDKIKNLNNDNQ